MKLSITSRENANAYPKQDAFGKKGPDRNENIMLSIMIKLDDIAALGQQKNAKRIIDGAIYGQVSKFAKAHFGKDVGAGTIAGSRRMITTYSKLGSPDSISIVHLSDANTIEIKTVGLAESKLAELKKSLEQKLE